MDIASILGSAFSNQKNGSSLLGVVGTILGGAKGGGLASLAGNFLQSDTGKKILDSWLGPGENQPISAEEVKQNVPQEKIAEVAQAGGISEDQAPEAIAKILPTLVDQTSPNGKVEINEQNVQKAVSSLDVGGIVSGLGDLFSTVTGGSQNQQPAAESTEKKM